MTAGPGRPAPEPIRSAPRSAARLAAVQALYQMDMAGADVNDVAAQFAADRLGQESEGTKYAPPDLDFFRAILTGVVQDQIRIDRLLDEQLAEGWRLARIDSTLRAILRSGAYEILARADIPARVVINEYMDVAHAFFEGEELKAVNGILDQFARRMRPGEFGASGDG